MSSHSVKLLLTFHFALTLLSLHPNGVQALSIPDVVARLTSRRNLESVTGDADAEEAQLKVLTELLDKARSKKSVTFQDEDFSVGDDEEKRSDAVNLKRFLQTKLSPSLDALKRAIFLKHSRSGADRDTKQHQEIQDNVQLKDRDYFQAIGIAPSGYDSNPYQSNNWGSNWSNWGSSYDNY